MEQTNQSQSKLQSGAYAAINQCLEIKPVDKVVIVTDQQTITIGDALYAETIKITPSVKILLIEDFIERPAKELPPEMAQEIRDFAPTVSIYAAQGQTGELPLFRAPLKDVLVRELNCRHAHMIGITKELMEDGMNKDYDYVYQVTKNVTNTVSKATKLKVTDPHGTNIDFDLDNAKLNWIPLSGKINKQGDWTNLPDGETFTCPKNANGTLVVWILGDDLMKYGELPSPIKIEIKDSYITQIQAVEPADAKTLEAVTDLKAYVSQQTDSNRVGELGIGTLVGLDHFSGNLLQDEKFPGVHVAFGHPYPHETGATWDCESHIDVIAKKTTIVAVMPDGSEETVMVDGKFEAKFLQ